MTNPDQAKSSRRILLADDNAAIQEVVRRVAHRQGHEVISVTAGALVVATAIESKPDVIVLDLEFPDVDGRDVLARLKQNAETAHIPVVVWSGRGGHTSDSRIALDLGAEDYVEKNDPQLLIRKLKRVLLRLETPA